MPNTQSENTPGLAAEPLTAHAHAQIISTWTERLQQVWNGGEKRKLILFLDVIEKQTDALSYLIARENPDDSSTSDHIVVRTVERIQSEDFDISDLFCEIRYLHEIIAETAAMDLNSSSSGNSITVRQTLDDFFETVARETSVVYEFFAERGNQALFILDKDGKITYSNNSARRQFGDAAGENSRFFSSLETADQARFDHMLNDLQDDAALSPICATLRVAGVDTNRRNINLELARLEHGTDRSVYYASLSPASKVLGVDDEVLENFDQGIVRVDSSRIVYYANRAARKLIGQTNPDDPFQPMQITDLFNGNEQAKIDAELQKREHGELGQYEIRMTQLSGRKIPVSVHAIPESDSTGNHIGSVAILRNLVEDRITADFNECLIDGDSWKDDLDHLSSLLFKYVNADVITIYRYTNDLKHVSVVSSLQRDGEKFPIDRRWFPLSPAMIEWNSEPNIKRYPDFPEFVQTPRMSELAEDDAIKSMVANGIKSFMASPIFSDGDNKAGLCFLGMDYDRFNQGDENLMFEIPISKAVLAAIQRKDREEKTFQFQLMAKLSKCRSFSDIANQVTSDLAEHYGWDNVSMFDVIEDRGLLTLITQHQGTDVDYVLADDYTQNSNKGLLGRAVREKRRIYAPEARKSEDFHKGHEKINSELIIPIFSRLYDPPRVFWLLNIEDSHTNFLIEDEIRDMEKIVEQIDFTVNRMILRVTFDHALASTSDGVIVTDANGDIRFANPASCEMLEYRDASMLINENITSLFQDVDFGEKFLQQKRRDSYRVDLMKENRTGSLPVLISKLELPEEVSDKFYAFKSLEAQKRLADLDAIERLIGDIANQVKTPLSLMHGMLYRLSCGDKSPNQADIDSFIERARKLLKKAELSYDRVAYAEPIASKARTIDTYVYLDRVFEKINRDLSYDDDGVLDLKIKGKLKPVSGDRHQIRFVCESLVAYLLRNLASNEKILIQITVNKTGLDLELSTASVRLSHESSSDTTDWDRAVSEVTFGQKAIRQIMAHHGGRYEEPVFDNDTGGLKFKLNFPTSQAIREK